MKYIKKELGAYNLHMIKTDKFKTVTMRIIFRTPIDKHTITIRNFLTDMLMYSTKKYNTNRKLALYSQELYNVVINVANNRLGSYNNTIFEMSLLNEKFTEKGIMEKCLELLQEIIFNPNIINNQFEEKSFVQIKKKLETELKSLTENSNRYSLIRLLENMDDDAPFSYRGNGYLEDLEKITPLNLYAFYKEFLKANAIDIYVLGDIDYEEIESLIKKHFNFHTYRNLVIPTIVPCTKKSRKIKEVVEPFEVKQSKLAIGCRLVDLEENERNYVLTLYNIILGGSTESKLFLKVREENSLAYYANSSVNKLDNILLVSSGIDAKDYQKALKLIKEQFKAMEKGDFTLEDVNKAKEFYMTSLYDSMDSSSQLLSMYYSRELINTDDFETRSKKIQEVTKEDIINISKKIKIDTVYLLKGSASHETN